MILFDDNIFQAVSVANCRSNVKRGSAMVCQTVKTNVYLNSECGFRLFVIDKQIMC